MRGQRVISARHSGFLESQSAGLHKGESCMDLELKGKVAIIGGASAGLGRACADVLAEEGGQDNHLQPHRRQPGAGRGGDTGHHRRRGAAHRRRPGKLRQHQGPGGISSQTVSHYGTLRKPALHGHHGQQLRRAAPGPGRIAADWKATPPRSSGRRLARVQRCPSTSSPACPARPYPT